MQPRYKRAYGGTLREVVDMYAKEKGIVDWKKETIIIDGEYVHMSLRKTLAMIGTPIMAEVWAGNKYSYWEV